VRPCRTGRVAPGIRWREGGASIVEFAVLGTLVFGMLTQLVVLFGLVHRATLATTAAAREVGRAVAVAADDADLARRTLITLDAVTRNHGLAAGSLAVGVEGDRRRAATVRVRVRTTVEVVRIPFLGAVPGPVIPVEATQLVRIDRYRSLP